MPCQSYQGQATTGGEWCIRVDAPIIDGTARPLTSGDTISSHIRSQPQGGSLIAAATVEIDAGDAVLTFDLADAAPGLCAWNVRMALVPEGVILTPWMELDILPSPTEAAE